MLSALEFKTAVFQRIDQPSYKLPIDERTLADADPLTILDSITCFPNKRRRRTRSRPSGETSSPWNAQASRVITSWKFVEQRREG